MDARRRDTATSVDRRSSNQAANDEFLLKVGRNLILFQKIEHVLKELVALGAISISNGKVGAPDPVLKQSLGLVASAFIQRHLGDSTSEPALKDNEVTVHTSFRIEGQVAAELTQMLLRAIPDRNRLAHRVIAEFDVSCNRGRRAAICWLDRSFSDHSPLLAALTNHQRTIRDGFREIVSFLQSKEGASAFFRLQVQGDRVVQQVVEAVAPAAGSNGWTLLADAARSLSRAEVRHTLRCFGMKSLTELLAASRLFELRAEESPSGRTRMLIRPAAETFLKLNPGSDGR